MSTTHELEELESALSYVDIHGRGMAAEIDAVIDSAARKYLAILEWLARYAPGTWAALEEEIRRARGPEAGTVDDSADAYRERGEDPVDHATCQHGGLLLTEGPDVYDCAEGC